MKMARLAVRGAGRTAYIGPLLDEEIGGRLAFRKIPSEAWFRAHPDGATEPPADAEMVVQCVVMGIHRWPSRLKPPAQWDEAQFPIVELSVTPYLEWKRAADAELARKKGGGPALLGGESEIDTAGDAPVIESATAEVVTESAPSFTKAQANVTPTRPATPEEIAEFERTKHLYAYAPPAGEMSAAIAAIKTPDEEA